MIKELWNIYEKYIKDINEDKDLYIYPYLCDDF